MGLVVPVVTVVWTTPSFYRPLSRVIRAHTAGVRTSPLSGQTYVSHDNGTGLRFSGANEQGGIQMNKMIKGSIAGGTGIALLMGGFGTYALWSDSATLEESSITSGTLDVAIDDDAEWTDNATPANTDTGDSWGYLMVPGDVVTRTQSFTFTGTGENLKGAITFSPGVETEQSNAANTPSAADLFSIDVTLSGLVLTESAPGSNCWEFTEADLPDTVDTEVKYTLTADNQDLQNVAASITDSTFTMVQDATCP